MATNIYIVKRKMKGQRKNGQPHYRYSLRWRDPLTGQPKCETAGTADMTQAKATRDRIYAEVNRLVPPASELEPETIKPRGRIAATRSSVQWRPTTYAHRPCLTL